MGKTKLKPVKPEAYEEMPFPWNVWYNFLLGALVSMGMAIFFLLSHFSATFMSATFVCIAALLLLVRAKAMHQDRLVDLP